MAATYTEQSHWGLGKWIRARETEVILQMIGTTTLGDVLELGSGSGYYTRLLNNRGCQRLVYVDFSATMLEKIQIPNGIKVEADIQDYIDEQQFDLILCAGALEFLERPEAVFHNAAEMLKTNGSLVVLMPTKTIFGLGYQLYHRLHQIRIRLFHLNQIQTWVEAVGLTLVKWQSAPLFSLVIKCTKTLKS